MTGEIGRCCQLFAILVFHKPCHVSMNYKGSALLFVATYVTGMQQRQIGFFLLHCNTGNLPLTAQFTYNIIYRPSDHTHDRYFMKLQGETLPAMSPHEEFKKGPEILLPVGRTI